MIKQLEEYQEREEPVTNEEIEEIKNFILYLSDKLLQYEHMYENEKEGN